MNKLTSMGKNPFFIFILLIVFKINNTQAQVSPIDSLATTKSNNAFEKGKEYILGGISVNGLQQFTEETVKTYSGLNIGQTIKLPGDKLTSAIKKLYESKQFSEVDVYLAKVDGNTVYLEFDIVELPQLNRVKISGIKKAKAKELRNETELTAGAQVTENLITTSRNYIQKKYTDKGYLKTKVNLTTEIDSSDANGVDMYIHIDKGEKVKIKNINFDNNIALSDKKLSCLLYTSDAADD